MARFRILKTDGMLAVEPEQMACLDGLDAELVERTCLTEAALIAEGAGADALMVLREPVTARVLAALPRLRVVGRFGVGLDTVDVDACTAAGVQVTNVPDSNLDEVSTHALALILALSRRLVRFDRAVRAGRWRALADGAGITRPDRQLLGLIGFGRIGRLTAAKARAVGFAVAACDPHVPDAAIAAEGVRPMPLDALVAAADVVSLHVPMTEATRDILSAARIATMKPGALVINVSRGGLVDEAALAAALTEGRLGGAGIDTLAFEPPEPGNPVLAAPNVILTPHAAHYSTESYAEVRTKVFADVAAVLGGGRPRYPVNFREGR
jgi:D-3-phosphoglycerate dehydrogenase